MTRAGGQRRKPDGLTHVAARLAALAGAGDEAPFRPEPLDDDDPLLAAPPLRALGEAFGLDAFEKQVLLLALGCELVPEMAALCARCHEDEARRWPTWRLAVALFPGSEWRSLGPGGPLRGWHLVETDAQPTLLDAPLRLAEWTLHFLCGAPNRDRAIADLIERLDPAEPPPSHAAVAAQLVDGLAAGDRRATLVSNDRPAARAVAAAAARRLDLPVDRFDLDAVLQAPDRSTLLRLIAREHALSPSLLLVELGEGETERTRAAAVTALVDRLPGAVLVTTADRATPAARGGIAAVLTPPTRDEQFARWRTLLGRAAAPLAPMLARFDLYEAAIDIAHAAAAAARKAARGRGWRPFVGEACRAQLRGALDPLAERVVSRATLDDLVLPPAPAAQLRAIVGDVDRQPQVLAAWNSGGGSGRGLGVAALFTGLSGAGKTTAAEALANALDLDLYRIDLSAVVSKYIGETEKQLAQLFAAAERSAAVLFFDEADALFAKRTETRSSNDRFANQEVAYLLQRLETYRGLAVLATNLADALDQAFLRRFRYVVHFPHPGPAEREAIWRRVYGPAVAVEGVDAARLARLQLTGGGIRNVALRAAFMAAAERTPVTMALLRRAAAEEYRKLHRVMTEEEWADD